MKADQRRKFSEVQVRRLVRTRLSTNADVIAGPFLKAFRDSFGRVQPVWLPHRPLWDRRLVAPSRSISAESPDTARSPSSTTSLSPRLLQSAAGIPSIRDQR